MPTLSFINMIITNYQVLLLVIMTAFVGGIAGYIGSLMVSKRMALMGGALGHLTMPGIALAMLYNFDVSLGAFLFLFLGIMIIWFFGQKTSLSWEALTAIVFASSVAISFLFLPKDKTIPALVGDISQVSWFSMIFTVFLSLLLFFIIKRIFSKIILIGISPDIAHSMGISVYYYNFVFLMTIAGVIALGIKIVGGLMTAALVAIPACTSKNISKNLFQYSFFSLILGCLSSVLGVLVFIFTGIPAGPLIILFNTFFFILSLIVL